MDSLRFGSWKDFSLGWWNALASAWLPASAILKVWHCGSNFLLVYAIMHEKSRTNIRENWPSYPWQYFRSFDCGIVILSVFMAPNRVVLPASRNKFHRKLLTCFSGRAALGLSFREHKRRNGQICPFSFEDILLTVDPCALFLTIAIAAASAAVSWAVCWVDFADSTSADHFDFNRLYSTAVNKVRCLQCSQMF